MAGKVVARIKGGLGNQLFCYAAARRLALANGAELALDTVSGFIRSEYPWPYGLRHFRVPVREATPGERMEPFERARRAVAKWTSRRKPFQERRYLEQEGLGFDERLLRYQVGGTVYLDGLWQSERYFKDVETTIRDDLRMIAPSDPANQSMAASMRRTEAVALHVRWFQPRGADAGHNAPAAYYGRAVAMMEDRLRSPAYYVFSDDPDAARAALVLPEGRATYVAHNRGNVDGFADLWLMAQCRHFITANSTFSWWGAWLAAHADKIVITPRLPPREVSITNWGFAGLIPDGWLQV